MFVYFQSAFLWNWSEILVCWIFVKLGICMHIPMENSENEFAIQKKATLRYFFSKSCQQGTLEPKYLEVWSHFVDHSRPFIMLHWAHCLLLVFQKPRISDLWCFQTRWQYEYVITFQAYCWLLVRSPTTSQLSDLWWSQARWQLRELLRLLDPTFNLDHD